MPELNPYYARESEVGPVFDVATFSRGKSLLMALCGLVFGALLLVATLYVWNPNRLVQQLVPKPPQAMAEANREVAKLWKEYPRGTQVGLGVAGFFAGVFLIAGSALVVQSFGGNYYIRVGEGGLSYRVPGGICPRAFDLPWDDIEQLTVVQEKRLGSLSPNAGNLGGYFTVRTRSHGSLYVCLSEFREPVHLIYDRIQEARDTRPAELAVSC